LYYPFFNKLFNLNSTTFCGTQNILLKVGVFSHSLYFSKKDFSGNNNSVENLSALFSIKSKLE
jgi:hypothetical protein